MPKNFTMKWVYAYKTTRLTNQQWILFEYPGLGTFLSSQFARRPRSNPLYGSASAYYRGVGNEAYHLPMHHLAASSDGLVARHPSEYDLDLHSVTIDQKYACSEQQSPHGRLNIACSLGHHPSNATRMLALIAE